MNLPQDQKDRTETMRDHKDRWMRLCSQAAVEQDPKRFMALIAEINDVLEQKERRLGALLSQRLDPGQRSS